jgi:hypothetical protein
MADTIPSVGLVLRRHPVAASWPYSHAAYFLNR